MTTMREAPTGARSAREVLDWSREVVDSGMRAAVDTLPESVRHIAGYHLGWWDVRGRPESADRGKALRPALTLLCTRAVGADSSVGLPAAVAVELTHNFSLLHDDVMDGDRTRRHRLTAWSAFGVGPAILAGDALLTLALDVLTTSGHPECRLAAHSLSDAVQELLHGQMLDLEFERRDSVSLDECLTMAEGKTAALLGRACALGALFGGGRPAQVQLLRSYGERLGLAFQLVDDLLGIWGDPRRTGKPVYSDVISRKKSLPVVAALTSGTDAGRELADLYGRPDPLSGPQLARAGELIELAGGRAWSADHAEEMLTEALRHLNASGPDPESAAELTAVARLVVARDR
ncbi:geranylgeranyl diphosphate synthase type I [Herbihabitans rhizosphaerae]|uniref:Geranylgeranyl diphosphate synthase type I n=1 Tax=Herbihabitans rhizosphaerae TaxID=1872711 RepID=A0A4Q7L208_9PSEU|nr:family 2 encapsulin nanocompartment cargo protein polyprenyl transferase [Herbihabitans rhizosphaerae]RZS43154.1 geranylgeranyl diphosphate synthase type I [Herbihabitans rhizosphaerae]